VVVVSGAAEVEVTEEVDPVADTDVVVAVAVVVEAVPPPQAETRSARETNQTK
jgi:hypothetical protein